MKKVLVLLLCAALCTSAFAACSSDGSEKGTEKGSETTAEVIEEADGLLPYGLEFGMSYEEANAVHTIPELERADTGKGYFVSEFTDSSDVVDFYSLENDIVRPMYGYSFNEDKALYEMYTIFTVENEGEAENAYNKLIDFYTEMTSVEPEVTEGDESLEARFEGENKISLLMDIVDDGFRISVVIHNVANEIG